MTILVLILVVCAMWGMWSAIVEWWRKSPAPRLPIQYTEEELLLGKRLEERLRKQQEEEFWKAWRVARFLDRVDSLRGKTGV